MAESALPLSGAGSSLPGRRKLLMVAYHFPPLQGSSGIQRTLHFARQLPDHGWDTAVLSVHPRAYEAISPSQLTDIPPQLEVVRCFALDSRRHLSLWHRYPGWLGRPDRWISWLAGAIPAGLLMVRRLRPDAIWSTYPIPSAHLIGYWLARLSRLPWVADFRDPMAHAGYPEDPQTWQSYWRLEQRIFARADLAIFATEGAAQLYRERYPQAAGRIRVIENGYDEAAFSALPAPPVSPRSQGPLRILHSGIVYPAWRNPAALFAALQQLRQQRQIGPDTLRLRFRAPVHDAFLSELAARHQVSELIELLPALPYHEALAEMQASDALLLLQSRECNAQIPAKYYEYLRAGRPILTLSDPDGDTAQAALGAGCSYLADLENTADIARMLGRYLADVAAATTPLAHPAAVAAAARSRRSIELARQLNALLDARSVATALGSRIALKEKP